MPALLAQAAAVVVTDDGRAFAAAGPVAARRIAAGGREHPLRVRARQNVVLVGLVAAAADDVAFLRQAGLLVDIDARGCPPSGAGQRVVAKYGIGPEQG